MQTSALARHSEFVSLELAGSPHVLMSTAQICVAEGRVAIQRSNAPRE
jgi:hypothetical protein